MVCPTAAASVAGIEIQSRNPTGKPARAALTHTLVDVSSQLNILQKSVDRTELAKACFQFVDKEQKRIRDFVNEVVAGSKEDTKPPIKQKPLVVPPRQPTAINYKGATTKHAGFMTVTARNGSISRGSGSKGRTTAATGVAAYSALKTLDMELKNCRLTGKALTSGMNTSRESGTGVQRRSGSSGGKKMPAERTAAVVMRGEVPGALKEQQQKTKMAKTIQGPKKGVRMMMSFK